MMGMHKTVLAYLQILSNNVFSLRPIHGMELY
jgi:hypothetical protein